MIRYFLTCDVANDGNRPHCRRSSCAVPLAALAEEQPLPGGLKTFEVGPKAAIVRKGRVLAFDKVIYRKWADVSGLTCVASKLSCLLDILHQGISGA